jgi:predicted membrane protein
MRSQGQLILSIVVILFGVVLLIANTMDVDLWMVCWPFLLIALGLTLLFRPQLIGSDSGSGARLLGDIRREGTWTVQGSEFWMGVGDVTLDLSDAKIPAGETVLRVWGFVTDVRITAPDDVGIAISSHSFITDARFLGLKRESVFSPLHLASENYETALRLVVLEARFFVGDIRVKRS